MNGTLAKIGLTSWRLTTKLQSLGVCVYQKNNVVNVHDYRRSEPSSSRVKWSLRMNRAFVYLHHSIGIERVPRGRSEQHINCTIFEWVFALVVLLGVGQVLPQEIFVCFWYMKIYNHIRQESCLHTVMKIWNLTRAWTISLFKVIQAIPSSCWRSACRLKSRFVKDLQSIN